MSSTVPLSVANATRTAVQAGPAWVVTEFTDAWIYDMNDRQFGALVALLLLIFAFIQPLVENYFGRALMRTPATSVPVAPTPQT